MTGLMHPRFSDTYCSCGGAYGMLSGVVSLLLLSCVVSGGKIPSTNTLYLDVFLPVELLFL